MSMHLAPATEIMGALILCVDDLGAPFGPTNPVSLYCTVPNDAAPLKKEQCSYAPILNRASRDVLKIVSALRGVDIPSVIVHPVDHDNVLVSGWFNR